MKKRILNIISFFNLKNVVSIILKYIKNVYYIFYNKFFNATIKEQNRNYKSIPIIIISYNQLVYLKELIDYLMKRDYNNIIIIDNNSNFPALLKYLNKISKKCIVHRLKENHGHLVFWLKKEFYLKYGKGYYVITDPDILPVKECPDDFILHFKRILDKNSKITKVGFSLKTDDIPKSNLIRENIIRWEKKFYSKKNKKGDYISEIDTTFALYKPINFLNKKDFLLAIRTKKPYVARHMGWYLDYKNLTEEQRHYLKTANNSSTWRVNEIGELVDKRYNII